MQRRLSALARAHDLVRPDLPSKEATLSAATFRRVMDDILAPYAMDEMNSRIALSGPDFRLAPTAVTSVALVLHELATNAIKYGCLKDQSGTLSVVWTFDDITLRIVWSENGFTCGGPPLRSGFGSTLIRTTVEYQLHGQINYEWRPDGLAVSIDLPFAAIAAGPL
jgi:two-component sensor histidine kinase